MQETGEPPTTAENKTEGSSAELQIHKIEDTESRYSDGNVETADTVDKDLSKDEFDSDLVIDKGECDTKGDQKRVAFKLDIEEMESVKTSHNSTLDSSQETIQTTVTHVMIWKEFLGYHIFFIIFVKHGYYFSGSWTQVSIVINSELHWF